MKSNISDLLSQAQEHSAQLKGIIEELNQFQDQSAAEIAKLLRLDSGADLDLEAIKATPARPYTLSSMFK